VRFRFLPDEAIRTLRYARSLAEPIPEPAVPTGYAIRSITGEGEVGALVTLHRAAFGTERLTTTEQLARMAAADYDPALDLVAVAPDGSLVAYRFCAICLDQRLHPRPAMTTESM